MVDPSSVGQAAQKVTQEIATETTKPGPADASDMSRFEAALNQPDGGTQASSAAEATSSAQSAQSTPPAEKAEGASSLGDSILNSVDRMRMDHRETVQNIEKALNSGESLSTEELLKIQMQVTRMTVEQDLSAKVASKLNQSIETLLKAQ